MTLTGTGSNNSSGSLEILEQIFESYPDAVVLSDSSGNITHCNAKAISMFGYSQSELLGQPVEMLIAPRQREAYRSAGQVRPPERFLSSAFELRGVRKDGTEFPIEMTLNRLRTSNAELIVEVIRNVTIQRHTLDMLHLIEERFRLLVENAVEYAMFLMDPSGMVITWNSGAERMKGYRADEVIGKPYSTFYSPEDTRAGKPEEALLRAREEGRFETEGWRVRKDGSRFWANAVITPVKDKVGNLIGFAKITRDFSERHVAEQLLQQSEARLQALFDFSPDVIIATDREGRMIDANARMQELFGYQRSDLLGQPIEILVPERFRNMHPKHRGNYIEAPRTRPMGAGLQLYGRRKDGTEVPVDIMLAKLDTPQGPIIISTIRDLTERRRTEGALYRAEQEKLYLEEEVRTGFGEIVGESSGLREVLHQVKTVAVMDATVLILGETGTGKELIARAVHQLSKRRERPFIKLNCAAIPSGLLESELFGHERGAFTGAIAQKVGRLELANHGTLFPDEVGDIPLELQPKLLRALQEKEFERLGSTRTISVDIRLVAATNRELEKMVSEKQFRSDLYYRLRVFPIQIPPLRERRQDIPLLVRYFVHMHAQRMDKNITVIPSETMQILTRWRWPGNVRELENFIERAVILTTGNVLRAPLIEIEAHEEIELANAKENASTLEDAERDHIVRALREAKGAIGGSGGAAERLGLKRTTLNSKIKKLGIERSEYI